eukprot:6172491-Pleurochrysis_carterae.AAC.1
MFEILFARLNIAGRHETAHVGGRAAAERASGVVKKVFEENLEDARRADSVMQAAEAAARAVMAMG